MPTDIISIVKQINEAAQQASTTSGNPEKRLRELVSPLWDNYIREKRIGLNFVGRDERMLATGRADTVFNRLILEYKKPDVINSDNKRNRKVIAQVKGYIEDLANEERWKEERLLGVAFDGKHFLFIRKVKRWIEEEPVAVNEESVERFLLTLEKLTTKAALVPENLIRDFAVGAGSLNYVASNTIRAFYHTLRRETNPRVKAFFDQWALQFAEVHGTIESKKFNPKTLFDTYGFKKDEQKDFNYLAFFFSLDTYYGLLMKLLAYQVVGFYTFKDLAGLPLTGWEKLDGDRLKEKLEQLEEGGIFRAEPLNIRNFLEGDLLSWYLYVWNNDIYNSIRGIIERLNQYDPETMELVPDETRDILKMLYQFLVPREIRHDLGEYYTPDWLAERCLNQVNYGVRVKGLLRKRLLDPGCGSGTFVVLGIKRAKEHAKLYGIDPAETLKFITRNIVGFDLNPLAVISARTNYLLAIADLLKYKDGEITIPIYLCDSINPPKAKEQADLEDMESGYYDISTSVGTFRFPDILIRKDLVVKVTSLLEDAVKLNKSTDELLNRIFQQEQLSDENKKQIEIILLNTFQKLLDLEHKGINGIWARIIKNAFAPLFMGEFEFVIGNPPWIGWENVPDDYKKKIRDKMIYYKIATKKGWNAMLGGAKYDISMLFTYVSIDKYLRDGGKLCFVITQVVFQGDAGEGFRNYSIRRNNKDVDFKVLAVDDLSDIQPFEEASTRTAVVLCQKNGTTKYPVNYGVWKEKDKIRSDDNLNEVRKKVKIENRKAAPVNPKLRNSRWFISGDRLGNIESKLLGASPYRAYQGANTEGANSIYFVKILETKPSGDFLISNGFSTYEIEGGFLHPLLKSSSVKKWEYNYDTYILFMSKHNKDDIQINILQSSHPKLYDYFQNNKEKLEERKSFKNKMGKAKYPFYTLYGRVEMESKLKVVWNRMKTPIQASVVNSVSDSFLGTAIPIPQEVLVFVDMQNSLEAHYLCALLNSNLVNRVAMRYSVKYGKDYGGVHILKNIRFPKYNSRINIHTELAKLSVTCHEKCSAGINVRDLEEYIDELVCELWDLTDDEIKYIKESMLED